MSAGASFTAGYGLWVTHSGVEYPSDHCIAGSLSVQPVQIVGSGADVRHDGMHSVMEAQDPQSNNLEGWHRSKYERCRVTQDARLAAFGSARASDRTTSWTELSM